MREPNKTVRVNHMIRVPRVRVIGPDGKQLGIMDTSSALRAALDEYSMDLIEISPTADPPVCRIMDHGKFKYQLKKKTQEAKKNQSVIVVKEIKLRPSTDEHDFDFKVKHIARFLEEGNKAKVTIRFKGRELVHSNLGRAMLDRIVATLGAKAMVEQTARLEGRNMFLVLAPRAHVVSNTGSK
ncbi:MAG: translation initiation factor IF-3 [Pseudomonadota bacterium]